ncbi:EF_hand domain-containing protein [Hexamita inflata]|uniref:EF hand domain-containing protein n=1 Tax=Hexamita inflata TaxID=28002 RepID=A0AA86QZI3_9EUKA|nr:EF hand domain-containing protein [Hexamita inflata]
MPKLSQSAIRSIFKALDSENTGKVSPQQMVAQLQKMDHKIDGEHVKFLMDMIDKNNDGTMDVHEFGVFMNVYENANHKVPASVFFYCADSDFSGTICHKELFEILKKLEINVTEAQSKQITKILSDNKDGTLSYQMFERIIELFTK